MQGNPYAVRGRSTSASHDPTGHFPYTIMKSLYILLAPFDEPYHELLMINSVTEEGGIDVQPGLTCATFLNRGLMAGCLGSHVKVCFCVGHFGEIQGQFPAQSLYIAAQLEDLISMHCSETRC